MLPLMLLVVVWDASWGQRYAERNVISSDWAPSSATEDYDYYAEDYGFEEKEENVYKWMVEEFPHPTNNSRFCNRLKPSSVCDPDMVLTKEYADTLDASIRKLYENTPCICPKCSRKDGGVVVGIALFKHMYLPYNIHPVKAIKAFTETLRKQWRLGQCDNDILIVVATADRLSYTDVGDSAAAYLSVHEAHRIFVANKAQFTAGNFFRGLRDILEGYQKRTENTMSSVGQKQNKDVDVALISGSIIGGIVAFGILLFIGVVVYKRCKERKTGATYNRKEDIDGKSSKGWTKQDIKVLFGSEKRKNSPPSTKAKYQPCQIEESVQQSSVEGDEVIDFRLATPADTSFQNETETTDLSSGTDALDKDLARAAENIVRTFPSTSKNSVLITDI